MKFIVFLLIIFVAISSSESRPNLATVVTNCPLLLPVKANSQTILLEIDLDSDSDLKTCILKNCNSEQTVLIVNVPTVKLRKVNNPMLKTSDSPNIIIMTKYITPKIFDSSVLRIFIQSYWSLLYIVVTRDRNFTCDNETDFVVLEHIMNQFWHQFRIMRVGLAFPFACKHKMIVYSGRKPSYRWVYDRSIQLINATDSRELYNTLMKSGEKLTHDYPMKGNIFTRFPTAVTDCKKLRYYVPLKPNDVIPFCGIDGLVTRDILQHFKFNATFSESVRCHDYGYYAGSGNISGSLGCIVRRELDISFNSRFLTLYGNEKINFLSYVFTDSLCAFVKRADVVPPWKGVYDVYGPTLWLIISAGIVGIATVMWAFVKIFRSLTGKKFVSFWFILADAVTMTLFGVAMMKTKTFILLKSACFLGSILFLAIYQGHISRVFTTINHYERIKTLDNLYRSENILLITQEVMEVTKQLLDKSNKVQESFFNRSHIIPKENIGIALQPRPVATLARKLDGMMEILGRYKDQYGVVTIDVVDECLYTYYLSYIGRTGFPFLEDLLIMMIRLNEAGLPKMYYKWTQRMYNLPDWKYEKNVEARHFREIRLTDHRASFGLLFIGTIASLIVFGIEMCKGKCKLCKRRESIKFLK